MPRLFMLLIAVITAAPILAGCDNAPNKPPKPVATVQLTR